MNWYNCQFCSTPSGNQRKLFRADLGINTVVEIKCPSCKRINTFATHLLQANGKEYKPDGEGGYVAVDQVKV